MVTLVHTMSQPKLVFDLDDNNKFDAYMKEL